MSDPNQAPIMEAVEAEQTEGSAVFERIQDFYRKSRLAHVASTALTAIGIWGAAEAYSAEPVAAENAPAQVTHSHSDLNLQSILNKIRHVAMPHNPLIASDNLHYVHPTSGFLESSEAAFKTNCTNFNYRFYEINTAGDGYKLCASALLPLKTPPIKQNQYTGALNELGNTIEQSVEVVATDSTVRVGGTRSKIVAAYSCEQQSSTNEVSITTTPKKIIIQKNHTATIATC